MRVLFVAPYLGATYGGIAKVVVELAEALGRNGIKIDIATTDADGNRRRTVVHNCWLNEQGKRVRYFPCWHRRDFILSPDLIQWAWRHAKNYDIVHTHSIFAPLIAAVQWICRRQQVPYVTTPHGMLEPWALAYKAWKKRTYYRLVERPALNNANFIHAIAAGEAEHIRALNLAAPVELIPNGLNPSEFAIHANTKSDEFFAAYPHLQDKRLLLFFGRLDPKKGLDLLAPAFAQIRTKYPDTHLLVVGPDNIGFLPRAKQFFAECSCLDAITFTGWIGGSLLYAMLRAVEVHVAPSYSEGFSMGILTCMAAGVPTIMTKGCNFPEAGAAGAARIVDASVNAVAGALDELLANPAAARAMGMRARDFVLNNYTWDRTAQKLITAYEHILTA